MNIYLAADHAGFELKEKIRTFLAGSEYADVYTVIDCGATEFDPNDDYPLIISRAAQKVSEDPAARAIVLGGSGQGEAIVADKFPHVRAVEYYGENEEIIRLSREHNDANVLSLGARFLSDEEAFRAVDLWLKTPFSGDERHVRRIAEIERIK